MFQINVLKFQGHWGGRVGKISGRWATLYLKGSDETQRKA